MTLQMYYPKCEIDKDTDRKSKLLVFYAPKKNTGIYVVIMVIR